VRHDHDYAECYQWEMNFKAMALLVILAVGGPLAAIECAGTQEYTERVSVIKKEFTGGRHTCYRLTYRSSRGDGAACVQPEDYLGTSIGSARTIKYTQGRLTKHIYTQSASDRRP
jgi:hypothetical protein